MTPSTHLRLTNKANANWGRQIHGHFFGTYGVTIEHPILHHKFLVKSYEERVKIAERYESISAGAGSAGYLTFTLPEDVPEAMASFSKIKEGVYK